MSLDDKLNLAWGQIRTFADFIEDITDIEPDNLYKTIVEKIAKVSDSNIVILYLIRKNGVEIEVVPQEVCGLDKKASDIRAVYLAGININKYSDLREYMYGDIKLICQDNTEFIIGRSLTFPLINQNNCIGLISINCVKDATKEEKEKIEGDAFIISKTASSLLRNALNIKKKIKEYTKKIEPLEQKNKELEENIANLKNECNNLEKQCDKLTFKRIGVTSIGIFIAIIISTGVMWMIKKMMGGNLDGLNLLYSMAGFTAFFAIISICFKLINEIKIGKEGFSATDKKE